MLIEKTIHQIYLSLPNPKRFPHSWIVILSSINPVHNGREQASIWEKAGGKNQKENLATKISNTGCHSLNLLANDIQIRFRISID